MRVSASQRDRWITKPIFAAETGSWLREKGSLTHRLQRHAASLHRPFVVVPQHRLVRPSLDEARLLECSPRCYVLQREVLLKAGETSMVFARSLLPLKALRGSWHVLGRLGDKPLGAVLFANPRVKRGPHRYRQLHYNHTLFKRSLREVPFESPPLWARRARFSLGRAHILVCEVFLTALLV